MLQSLKRMLIDNSTRKLPSYQLTTTRGGMLLMPVPAMRRVDRGSDQTSLAMTRRLLHLGEISSAYCVSAGSLQREPFAFSGKATPSYLGKRPLSVVSCRVQATCNCRGSGRRIYASTRRALCEQKTLIQVKSGGWCLSTICTCRCRA